MINDDGSGSIFDLSTILSCGDVELSAWCQNGKTQLLALYLRRGEFLLCLLTDSKPKIQTVQWYKDSVHRPVSLSFSPSGTFLLVLSEACHLYTIPALPLLDPTFKQDTALDGTDITVWPYPYKKDQTSRRSSSSSNCGDSGLDMAYKIKEVAGKRSEKVGTVVTWYQTLEESQQIACVGTNSGELFFVDLQTGSKIASTFVRGGSINDLKVCLDNGMDSVFLLISAKNQQYKLTMEQRAAFPCSKSGKSRSRGGSSEEGEDEPPKTYRARLHGFKQMSVEKLATIKMKIAETRAKAQLKPAPEDTGLKGMLSQSPEPLELPVYNSVVTLQYSRGRNVLCSYHASMQLFTVHTTMLEVNPLFVHKMIAGTGSCLLTDRIIYVVTQDKQHVIAVSGHLSEARLERDAEFNPDSVLGTFAMASEAGNANDEDETKETVIAVYKGCALVPPLQLPEEWRVDGLEKLLDESGGIEPCFVVTTHKVVKLYVANHIVGTMIRMILDKHALIQAERLCKIFQLNLSKVLELAGDIDMVRQKFPAAIARFKLASCDPLRIAVKLGKLGHCSELLSYSTALLTSPHSNLGLTDHIHISNLLLMSFVHQILKGAGPHLRRKFLNFLEENDYYDKGLGISVSAQAFLLSAVHKLITSRGLIAEGLGVVASLVTTFDQEPNMFLAAEDEDMWLCLSEPSLQEAFVNRREHFEAFTCFLSRRVHLIPKYALKRFCRALDPSSPCFRSLLKLPPNEEEDAFPLSSMVQLFLTTLLVLLSKEPLQYDKCLMLQDEIELTDHVEVQSNGFATPDNDDDGDQIWAVRKARRDSSHDSSDGCVLSAGFGHTALIRNGSVITWGISQKGCLGRGPGLARHSPPEPVNWFTNYRLQVSHISCGRAHTVALTNYGVFAWGSSQFGQLGLGPLLESPHPRMVAMPAGRRVVSVKCGQYHTLFLTSCGSLLGCGWNVHGQLGLGTIENIRTPTHIHTLKEHVIIDFGAGHGHSLVVTETGHVYCFGSSSFGQLGTGNNGKRTLPVLVKGLPGRVIKVATGYFHNLALTSSNNLYIWGASPQVLRLQGQAHKRARAMNLASPGSEEAPAEFVASDAHLRPLQVDTRNVSGKITKIACGCHHHALVTENGSLYTWGRSMDGQLGNGSRSEVVVPSLVQDGSLKVSAVSLGCDFSVAVDKTSSKVFAWGSNNFGQIGVPIKDTMGRTTDGKIIIVKAVKRVVRLPHSIANLVDTPQEVPGIPSATFTYQSLNCSTSTSPAPALPEEYSPAIWHRTLHKFFSIISPDLLLCKCLELNNHQAASKILLLQGRIRQSLVHQLKALQRAHKLRENEEERERGKRSGRAGGGGDRGKKSVETPDAEIHPFTVQGGNEGMCDMDVDVSHTNGVDEKSPCHSPDMLIREYTNSAHEVLLRYLIHAPHDAANIIETSIQFWTAQKLPMDHLEGFFKEHMERVFYPLGTLLYLGKRDFSRHFSADLQFRLTSRLIAHVEQNGSCEEFVAVLSRFLSMDDRASVADLSAKLTGPPKKTIHVNWTHCPAEGLFVFSCGHSKSSIVIPPEQSRLAEAYAKLKTEGTIDMACPDCVCNLVSAEVA